MLDVDQGGGSVLGEAAQRLTQQAVPKPSLERGNAARAVLLFHPSPGKLLLRCSSLANPD